MMTETFCVNYPFKLYFHSVARQEFCCDIHQCGPRERPGFIILRASIVSEMRMIV